MSTATVERQNAMRLPDSTPSWGVLVLLGLALVLIQPYVGRYNQDLLTSLLLYVAGASAWNIVGGMAGQFSLAHSVFIGAGSYTAVMVLRDQAVAPLLAVAAAAVTGAAIAALISGALLRLRGAYFTVGSMAVALAALAWMTTWDFTGATTGISAPIMSVPTPEMLYIYALVAAIMAVGVSIAVYHSPFGLRLMAVRDDEDVADSLGISPFRSKLTALVLSGAITAVVGAILAYQRISVEPFSAFSLNWTMTFVVMSIIGGLGTVWGPAIGATIIYYGLTVQLESLPTLSTIISGSLMIVLIKFLPGGILSGISRLRMRLSDRSQPR